eukprot:1436345-Ditylum_brightwellii.AAC.1
MFVIMLEDNEDMELNHLVLEYDETLSNINGLQHQWSPASMFAKIMFKCKKQCYGKSMHNIYSNNNNDEKYNNEDNSQDSGYCGTYIMSIVGGKSFVT